MQPDFFSNNLIIAPHPRGANRDFYNSDEWLRTRYLVLRESSGRCECCGGRPVPGNPLQVDHIKPRSLYPWLELEPDNLQVLCRDCNMGKSNVDNTDWRMISDVLR